MNLSEINPYIRLTMRSVLAVPSHINRRIIFDYELIYIEDGDFVLTYNDKDFSVNTGDILFLLPNVPHSFHMLSTPVLQPHIHFDLKYDRYSKDVFVSFQDYCDLTPAQQAMVRENAFPNLDKSPFLKITDKETFLRIFFEVVYSNDRNSLINKAKMLCLLQMIISENAPNAFSTTSSQSDIPSLIKSYLDSNYTQDITLDNLEQQFSYSKYYMEKLFKQTYGLSIINYRNKKRMEEAVNLLKKRSVSETAQTLGFSSIYTFSRAFRTVYGVSPTQYMEKQE